MHSPPTRRQVATAPATATPVARPVLHRLRFTMSNGLLEVDDADMVLRLLENEQRQRLAAEAEQAALSTCYKLSGEPDPTKPFGGLLTIRLGISQRSAEQLLRDGKLRYACAGRKAYRISERAVREFLGDMPPT